MLLLVAVIVLISQSAAQPTSTCPPTEPCCFSDLPSSIDLGVPAKLAKPSWMRACLSGVKTTDEVAQRTIDVLLKGVVPMYSFGNLAIDSLNTDAEVASPEADRVGVHDVKVDIATLIEDVYEKSKLESGGYNSLEFHFGLNRAFSSLNDAHTAYYTPFSKWILLSAVGVRPAQDDTGKLVFRLTQPTGSVTAVPSVRAFLHSTTTCLRLDISTLAARLQQHLTIRYLLQKTWSSAAIYISLLLTCLCPISSSGIHGCHRLPSARRHAARRENCHINQWPASGGIRQGGHGFTRVLQERRSAPQRVSFGHGIRHPALRRRRCMGPA